MIVTDVLRRARQRAKLLAAWGAVALDRDDMDGWRLHIRRTFKLYQAGKNRHSRTGIDDLIERWIRRFPHAPEPLLAKAVAAYQHGDPRAFELFEAYGARQQEKRATLGIEKLNMEVVPYETFFGALGNHWAFYSALKARKLGLMDPTKFVCLLPDRSRLTNAALFEYFSDYMEVIEDPQVCRTLTYFQEQATWPLGFVLPLKTGTLSMSHGYAYLSGKSGATEKPLFVLKEHHKRDGERNLRDLGIGPDDWFVCLHVRETQGSWEDNRNADPLSYIPAIREITKRGGWVIRMGDARMTPLPKMDRVVDYPFSKFKSDRMDVFLFASCRFQLGCSSGPYAVSQMFGVPVLLANGVEYAGCPYSLSGQDMFLPKLLRRIGGELLTMEEGLSPPVATLSVSSFYRRYGFEWIDNTPEDLAAAVVDMLAYVSGEYHPNEDEARLQLMWEEASIRAAARYKHFHDEIKAQPQIPRSFLQKYRHLFDVPSRARAAQRPETELPVLSLRT